MAKQISVWYDREGDYLEVTFANRKGYFKDAGEDLFIRVDQKGQVLGFAILNMSKQIQVAKRIKLPVAVELKELRR